MQKKIALFVTSVHLLTLLFLCFSSVKKPLLPKKHIAVRTIQPKTRTHQNVGPIVAAPKPIKKETPKTTAAAKPVPTKPAPAKPSPTKPIPQKKPAMVEKGKPKKPAPDKVWKEIDEALAKIDDKVYSKPQSKLDIPQLEEFSFGNDGGEEETLASFLQTSLNLPEFGEVKIQMTIKKDGTVARLTVLQAESHKNKAYLEKILPLLRFPLILDKEKTFTFTFCNEI